jgi:hypothetical protein
VFNKGYRAILGTMTAEQLDREIRHRPLDNNNNEHNDLNTGVIRGYDDDDNSDADDKREKPMVRKRAKKANRTYEERLKKRQIQEGNAES